jgi:DNA-binding winged helix-turn-helix (wHTH) protein/tetratricopeptide (TPR) repeat protein
MKLFRAFRLDTVNHSLWHGEQRVSLTPKAFDVLRYLVEHSDRLVTQDEILQALWLDTYVNPEVIKKYVLGIRKVLGDRSDKPTFIATFPKRGYQFIAPVRNEAAAEPSDSPASTGKTVVGRESSLAQLVDCLDKALQGQRQIAFLTGEAGVGKTTLMDLFHRRVADRPNLRIARGQCVEGFGGKEAYYPLLEALGQLIHDALGNPMVQALAKRAPTWFIQFPFLVRADQREALQQEILGTTRERMVREICEALETVTLENPLVLILEDLHWVDPSTLDVISAVARRRGPAKLLLLCTYRPAEVVLSQSPLKALKQDLSLHHLCAEISLERLEESHVNEYLDAEFASGSLPSGLAKVIHRHSGGNPLFMVAIVQDLIKNGLIAQEHGNWMLTRPLESIAPGVPETLQQMLDLQFSQLSAEEQRILNSGSVVGERFSVWVIRETLNIDTDRIEDLLEGLSERQQFIRTAGIQELPDGSISAHYEFRHSLFRHVLYRRLSNVSRSKLHRRIGERLRLLHVPGKPELASELALHFEEGHKYELAVRYLLLSAENAQHRFAHGDAIVVLQHALQLVHKIPFDIRLELEIQILKRIGDAHYSLGQVIEAAQAYQTEADRAAEANLTREEVSALSRLAYTTSPTDSLRGIAVSERAVELSKRLDDPTLLARTQILAAAFRLLHDRWRKEDAEICRTNISLIEQLNAKDNQIAHEILYPAQAQILQGQYCFALNAESKVRSMADTSGLMFYLGAWGKALALLHTGQLGELAVTLRTLIDTAEKNGNKLWFCAFSGMDAWLRILAFDFQGARKLCDTLLPMCIGQPGRTPRAVALLSLGHAELGLGNNQKAVDCFREVESMTKQKFYMYWYWHMQAQLGLSDVWLATGELAKAPAEANHFLESALSTDDPNLQVLAWELTTRVAIAQKNWKDAEEYAQKALATLSNFETPTVAWRADATAWNLYRHLKNYKAAEIYRKRAEEEILSIANSFDAEEPLRRSFLAAAPVRRILDGAVKAKTSRARGSSSATM